MKKFEAELERNLYASKSKGYGKIMVRDIVEDHEAIRILMVNYARESACYLDENRRDELYFKYTKQFENAFAINPNIKDCLLIGGAGCSYPKYYLSHHLESNMDVVEINPEMLEIAHKYFFLDDFIEKYGKDSKGALNGRLGLFVDEGMKYLAKCEKSYDCIINDAYIGSSLDSGLMSYRGVAQVKRHLNSKGIYLVNIITGLSGFYGIEAKKAKEVFGANFKNVYLYTTRPDVSPFEKQNCILIGTDMEIPELEIL